MVVRSSVDGVALSEKCPIQEKGRTSSCPTSAFERSRWRGGRFAWNKVRLPQLLELSCFDTHRVVG
jgi:hypothetical protein